MNGRNVAFEKGVGCCALISTPAFVDMRLADALVLVFL